MLSLIEKNTALVLSIKEEQPMKKRHRSEKVILDELSELGGLLRKLLRGLSIGQWIAMIRKQLGMSQKNLSSRAKIPPSTLSRIEQDKGVPNLSTLKKILDAVSCDLILVPVLRESIDHQRRKQARLKAEKHAQYLMGTMSLEEQEPDSRFLRELMKEKEEEWLHAKTKLWDKKND
jgi:transcriptional regulator with XRE-family HTH domain